MRSFKDTGKVPNVVNLASRTPATHMLVVRHRDRPGVLAHVFDHLREANLNVQETENIVFDGAEAAVARINLDGPPDGGIVRQDKRRQHRRPRSAGGHALNPLSRLPQLPRNHREEREARDGHEGQEMEFFALFGASRSSHESVTCEKIGSYHYLFKPFHIFRPSSNPMTTTNRIFNFSAGPAVLPVEVLEEAQRDLIALPGVGMSILEISHRSKPFDDVIEGCEADLRALAGIPANYHVLFLQGGASLQFSMVPMNILPPGGSADYIVTGSWSEKAVKEAKRVGGVKIAASTASEKFARVPKQSELTLDPAAAYVHYTTNNTIFGTEWHVRAGCRRRAARCGHVVRHVQPSDRRRKVSGSSTRARRRTSGPRG